MERKTKVHAEEGRQELTITREFNLPVALLFRAYSEAGIVAQWMGTKVVKLENHAHGCYRFETSGPDGNVLFSAHGTIHEVTPNERIVRTFEMENAGFDVQLEFLCFEPLTESTSRLTMQVIYKSAELRAAQLKLPFAFGLNMAHNRLEEVAGSFI
jgi:uncharacterized protein YndB with AHSA1/START domain